jgi:glycosyltransferase involved in cell wall biosynthesis
MPQIGSRVSCERRSIDRRVFVVLPAYNEGARLDLLFGKIDATLAGAGQPYEIVLVDDGSTDGTAEAAARWSSGLRLHVATHPTNMGLGAAIRDGLMIAAARAQPPRTSWSRWTPTTPRHPG